MLKCWSNSSRGALAKAKTEVEADEGSHNEAPNLPTLFNKEIKEDK